MADLSARLEGQEGRPGFYILKEKEIGGEPQDDGAGRHTIFLDSKRITSFARMEGGITDEGMLSLLTTAEGFRKLVHSVGIAVAAPDANPYIGLTLSFRAECGSCSCRRFSIRGDGAEHVFSLDDLAWPERGMEAEYLLFELPSDRDLAAVTVKLYVNDGFTVPEQVRDAPVDFKGPLYRDLVARSFLSGGNNLRVQKFLRRALDGEPVTVAFLGGSITQGVGAVPIQENCYARRTYEALKERYGENIRYIKAGVRGTPSETGLMRYDRDIARGGAVEPDLVVLEFAVNDGEDETEGVFYESLVRRILSAPNEPAVILLLSVFADDWNLKPRLAAVGYRYQLPQVDLLEAVVPQFDLKPGEGRVISRRQYFYDFYHPSSLGHKVMSDCLLHMLDRIGSQRPDLPADDNVPPYYGADFEKLRFLDRRDIAEGALIMPGSFTGTDEELQRVPQDSDTVNTPVFPYNWMKAPGEEPFVLELDCRRLVLEFKDSGDTRFGKARVAVDGELKRIIDPRNTGWTHCHATVLINGRETRHHRVEISMDPESQDKVFTVLGFGYVK